MIDQFIEALADAWAERGADILHDMAENDPAAYICLVAEIVKMGDAKALQD